MAEAIFNSMATKHGLNYRALSAGTVGAGILNPVVVEAMLESGLSLQGQFPKALTQDMADNAELIISMGCGVDAEACPAKFLVTQDWGLDDPAGQPIETVRNIRDEIEKRVKALIKDLQ